ncbi:MAG: APC family permease [Chloroflexi bacterium]|nr:MAG: APC family permease [Chloroflexota bacterium]
MAETTAGRIQTELKPDSLGLVSVTMQAITHIAPAIAALFFTQFLVTLSGLTAPLAYLIGVVVVLMLGNTLIQFSRQLPSAGGYYTYVSRSLGARAGFLTSWMFILYSPMAGGVVSGFFGFIAAGELKASYGWDVPWLWWVSIIVVGSIVALLQYRGMELSARTLLITGGAEILIVLALAFTGFAKPGPGGISLSEFNPANIGVGTAYGFSGFTLAIVLAVQGLTGWEAAAPLAEETRDPKRNVPRSVLLSILILGVFLVFTYWAIITGFGPDNIKGVQTSSDLPGLALARNVWGGGWWFVLIAFMSSTLAVSLATANVSTRMWYALGRNGAFPKLFAKVHPVYKTPTNAIFAQLTLTLGSGLIAGAWFHPDVAFFLLTGLVLVLGVSFVYLAANVGVIVYYWRELHSQFNWLWHAILPVVSSLVLLYALYESFPPGCPAVNCPVDPFAKAPLVAGGWLLIGIILLVYYAASGRDRWLKTAGAALGESEDDVAMAKVAPVSPKV